jgi:hypothetical protein
MSWFDAHIVDGIVNLMGKITMVVACINGAIDTYLVGVALRGGSTLDLSRLLRVPDGLSFAVAERVSATWDRRDNPFDATRGTFLFASVEHVHAAPADSSATITSDILRLTSRVAGYVRLTESGLAVAVSFRWGYNVQLNKFSQTYPDRLFYFGGVDSIRGLQDSVIPQDPYTIIAGTAPPEPTRKNCRQRGPDPAATCFNPRTEHASARRIFQTVAFLDTGNVGWCRRRSCLPAALRCRHRPAREHSGGALALGSGELITGMEDPFASIRIGLF